MFSLNQWSLFEIPFNDILYTNKDFNVVTNIKPFFEKSMIPKLLNFSSHLIRTFSVVKNSKYELLLLSFVF